ncbi:MULTISPECIES: HlyD family secretion protein [unclassified Ensifer]|uniref:HlyD family secretion protein n=1 Tax=unclassified Ensifer TaxID=2633371 RepID=UPI000813A85A|nr:MULTISPECIES: HlyD family secretion protein [unclassified Ensifer]OCP00701.1 hemolysin secretion protein D [Ensifer sp. LC13]OCP00775.1 hemolysin secretion protein D [Ensifer sp. LC11]OCP07395.1 hemolysin secretion protein D [Ensifer sp. LC14]OCP29505.1 hemolysin secretion protein D [Ensifer sp. LC499]
MLKFLRSPTALVVLLAGIGGIALVLYAWRLPPFHSSVEMTENAYVRGYVTIMSPQLSGYVAEVPVHDYETVKAGQLLAKIDDRIYAQKLAQAEATLAGQKAALANSYQQELAAKAGISASQAQLDGARAAFNRARATWDRIRPLAEKGVATRSDADQARAGFEQANAAVNQAAAGLQVSKQALATTLGARAGLEAAVTGAGAAVELARIDLDNTCIVAPRDGRLGEIGARIGQYVTAGSQLLALVPNDVWVVANFKETQLEGMKAGQPVTIAVDALQKSELTGHIERFAPAAGSEFSVIRPDNATGNFTKVAQRVGVRIVVDPGQPLADMLSPGLSVVVRVDKDAPTQTSADQAASRAMPAALRGSGA